MCDIDDAAKLIEIEGKTGRITSEGMRLKRLGKQVNPSSRGKRQQC